eukprot:gi/632940723/ref/XP_007885471.1/ PREDICTED: glutamate-rich protein 3 [Callorhinchus milii]
MSHSYPGQLAYNSLTDKHLAGYFNNTRIRRHLQKAGLITRSGRIVSEKEYRLNIVRKDHHKYVRECLAQAIFHKVLDMERHHQIEIKKQLEDFARRERVQRIKVERARRSDEDFVPFLSPHPPTTPRIGHRIRHGPDVEQSDSSTSPTSPRPNTAPGTMQRPVRLQPVRSNGPGVFMARSPSGVRQKEQHLEMIDEIDPHYFYALDREAIKNWTTANYTTGISPYRLPVIPVINNYVTPVPPPPRKRQKNLKGMTNAGARIRRLRPTTAPNGFEDVEPKEAPRFHRTAIHSNVLITMIYFGKSLHLSYDRDDLREEVKVYQQHCGGENLCVFKGKLLEGEKFQFISKRHRGFPFSLTFFMYGMQVDRLSSCCEHKHRRGSRLGGKHGHFGFVNVDGASPCYKCIIAMGLDKKPTPPPKRMKQEEEEPEKQVVESSNNEEELAEEKLPDGAEKEAMSDDSSSAGDKVSGEVKMEIEPAVDAQDERSKQEYDDDFEEDEEILKETGGQKEEGLEISEHNQENSIGSQGDDRIDADDDGKKSAKLMGKEKEKADGEEDGRSSYTDSELEEGRKSCMSSQSPTYSLSSSESDSKREEEKIKVEEGQSMSSGGEQTESINYAVEIEEQANIERDSHDLKETNDEKPVEEKEDEKLKEENGIAEEVDGVEPVTEELVRKEMFALVSAEDTKEKHEKSKEVDSMEKADSFKDNAYNEEIKVIEESPDLKGKKSEYEECINEEKSVCDEQSESGHFSGEEHKSVQEKIADAIKKDERCNSEPEPSDSSTEEEDDLLNAVAEKLSEQRCDSQREEIAAITAAQEQGEVARELNLLEEITVASAVPLSNEHIKSLETIATLEDESLTDHIQISGQEVEDTQTGTISAKATALGVEETSVKEQEDGNLIAATEEIAKNPKEFISADGEDICLKELEPENEKTLPDEPAQIEQQTEGEKEVEVEQDVGQCNSGKGTRVESMNTPDQDQNVPSADVDTESLKADVSRLQDENPVKFPNVLLSQTVAEPSSTEIDPEDEKTLPEEPAQIEQPTEEGKKVEVEIETKPPNRETVVNIRCTPENDLPLVLETTMTPSEVEAKTVEILASSPDADVVRDTKYNEYSRIKLIKPAVIYSLPNVSTTEEESVSEPETLMIKNEFMEYADQLVSSCSQYVTSENQYVALALMSALKCENNEELTSVALVSEPETGERDTGATETNITPQSSINQSNSISPEELPSVESKASTALTSIELQSETNADDLFHIKGINEGDAKELQVRTFTAESVSKPNQDVNESTEKPSESDPPLQMSAADCSESEEDGGTLEKELKPVEVSEEEQRMDFSQVDGYQEMNRDDNRIAANDLGKIRDETQNEISAGTSVEELSGIEETESAFGFEDEEVAEENSKCQASEMENSGDIQEKKDSELQVIEFISVTEIPVPNVVSTDQMGITMTSIASNVKLESGLETQIAETDADSKAKVMKDLNKAPVGQTEDEYHSEGKKIEVRSYGKAEQIEADLSHETQEHKTERNSELQMKTGVGLEAFSADTQAYVLINTDKTETCSEDHILEHDAKTVQEHEIDTDTQGFAFDTESYPPGHEAEVKLEAQKAHTLNQIENTDARSENQIEGSIELGTNEQAAKGEADPTDGEDIAEIKVISLVNTESTEVRSEQQDIAMAKVDSELQEHKLEADVVVAEIEVHTLYNTDNTEIMLKKQDKASAEIDIEVQEYKIETNPEFFVAETDLQQLNKVQNTGRRSEEQDEGRAEAETEIYVDVGGTQESREEKIQPSLELQAQENKPRLEAKVVELEVEVEAEEQEAMLSEAPVVEADQDISPDVELSAVEIPEIPGSQTDETNGDPETQTSRTLETQQTDIDAKPTSSATKIEIVSESKVEEMEKDPEAQSSKSAVKSQGGKTIEEQELETMVEVVQGDYAKSDSSSHFPTLHDKESLTGANDKPFIPVPIPQGETRIEDANIGVSLEKATLETITTKTVGSETNCADSTESQTMITFISPLVIKELTEQGPMYPKSKTEVNAELVKLISLGIEEDARFSSPVIHPTVNTDHPPKLMEGNS